MKLVLIQARITEEEIQGLIQEFPQYIFLAPGDVNIKALGKEEWNQVEIFYGNRLNAEELEKAVQLRWVHSPMPYLGPLCLREIEERGNIIVTSTKEVNLTQIAEYVIAGVLAYAKNLFHWETADRNPEILWDSKWRDSMWTLEDRTFLQIGLGNVGSKLAEQANMMRMKVWGVQERKTFHPHCHKIFSYHELHSLLPAADVVSIALPRGKQKDRFFGRNEIELMKKDSILTMIGSKTIIDEEALAEIALETGKFRGILFDVYYQIPILPSSKLWAVPNLIITPEVAPRPKSVKHEPYRLFCYNLRQYLHGNFADMRNPLRFDEGQSI